MYKCNNRYILYESFDGLIEQNTTPVKSIKENQVPAPGGMATERRFSRSPLESFAFPVRGVPENMAHTLSYRMYYYDNVIVLGADVCAFKIYSAGVVSVIEKHNKRSRGGKPFVSESKYPTTTMEYAWRFETIKRFDAWGI